jgi:hypothetical protein
MIRKRRVYRFVNPILPLFVRRKEGGAKFWLDDGGEEEKGERDTEDRHL